MKMSFPLFLGLLVVLVGLSIVLEAIFKTHVPLLRSALALLLVVLGVRMLIGAWSPRPVEASTTGSAVMSNVRYVPTSPAEQLKYDIIFGRGTIDLTQLPKPERPMTVEVNAIFSNATVTIDPSWPVWVEGSSAFAQVRMPDQSSAVFGTALYRTGDGNSQPLIRLRVNAVFGSCSVLESGSAPKTRPGAISAVTP